MKKIILLTMFLNLCIVTNLFAGWIIEPVENDVCDYILRYDLEDETALYSSPYNGTGKIKGSVDIAIAFDPLAKIEFRFLIHEDSMKSNVREFYTDTESTIYFLSQADEKVLYRTGASNSRYYTGWNIVSANPGAELYNFINSTTENKLICRIDVEDYRYSFLLELSDFKEIFNQYYDQIYKKDGVWYKQKESEQVTNMINAIALLFGGRISSPYSYIYKITEHTDDINFTAFIKIDDGESYPQLSLILNRYNDNELFNSSNEEEIFPISRKIIVGDQVFISKADDEYWMGNFKSKAEYRDILNAASENTDMTIQCAFSDGSDFEFKFKTADFINACEDIME